LRQILGMYLELNVSIWIFYWLIWGQNFHFVDQKLLDQKSKLYDSTEYFDFILR